MDEPRQDDQGAAAEVQGEPAPKNKGWFQKNDPRIRPLQAKNAGENAEEATEDVEDDEDGVPQQLRDMRHVYERPAAKDKTQGQKTCREWLKDDRKAFMSAKTQLEGKLLGKQEAEAAAKKNQPAGDGEEGKVDEGSARAMKVCRDFLDKLRRNEAEEDAKLAARPDAAKIGATLQNALKGSLERGKMLEGMVDRLRAKVEKLGGYTQGDDDGGL